MININEISIFLDMEESELETILEVSREEVYKEGEEIFSDGSMGDSLYVIMDGEVDISKDGQILTVLEPGKFFGEMSLLDASPRSAAASASTDCRLIVITKEAVEALYSENVVAVCKLFISIFKDISQKLRNLNESYVQTKKNIGPNFDDF